MKSPNLVPCGIFHPSPLACLQSPIPTAKTLSLTTCILLPTCYSIYVYWFQNYSYTPTRETTLTVRVWYLCKFPFVCSLRFHSFSELLRPAHFPPTIFSEVILFICNILGYFCHSLHSILGTDCLNIVF